MRAPVIGLTGYLTRAAWGVWDADTVLLPWTYVEAVSRCDAVPVILPSVPDLVAGAVSRLDGLILSGGPDIEPGRYGQVPGPNTQEPVLDRDATEFAALAAADAADLPVLGICRGMQLVNVARGGTLHQHLPDVVGNDEHAVAPGVYNPHPVRVAPDSLLADAVGGTSLEAVPSYHHQGIAELGSGLVATGWAPDGSIEAVEDPAHPFCLAVQWHPEAGRDLSLFEALVAAARRYAAGRSYAS